MAVPIVLSPSTAYATKPNIKFVGTSTQATAHETAADTRIEDVYPGITVTVAAGTVKYQTS